MGAPNLSGALLASAALFLAVWGAFVFFKDEFKGDATISGLLVIIKSVVVGMSIGVTLATFGLSWEHAIHCGVIC